MLPKPPLSVSLQQWLKRWEDLLDNYAIAFSGRMNAIGLVERGGPCHTIEKKWNPRQVIPLLACTVNRALAAGWNCTARVDRGE